MSLVRASTGLEELHQLPRYLLQGYGYTGTEDRRSLLFLRLAEGHEDFYRRQPWYMDKEYPDGQGWLLGSDLPALLAGDLLRGPVAYQTFKRVYLTDQEAVAEIARHRRHANHLAVNAYYVARGRPPLRPEEPPPVHYYR